MEESKNIVNTARGVVIDDGELLVFRQEGADYYFLLGGKIEFGENIEDAIAREIFEETGIKAEIGKLLLVHDMAFTNRHAIEFFYEIKNGSDYRNIDFTKATHGFETSEAIFVNVEKTDKVILPAFLKEVVPEIIKSGTDNFEFRIIKGEKR